MRSAVLRTYDVCGRPLELVGALEPQFFTEWLDKLGIHGPGIALAVGHQGWTDYGHA